MDRQGNSWGFINHSALMGWDGKGFFWKNKKTIISVLIFILFFFMYAENGFLYTWGGIAFAKDEYSSEHNKKEKKVRKRGKELDDEYIRYLSIIGEKCSGLHRDLIYGVIKVESNGRKYCINNNTKKVSKCDFKSKEEAVQWAYQQNDINIDVGIMQINYKYWHEKSKMGLVDLLEPVYNVCYGSLILREYIYDEYYKKKNDKYNGWAGVGKYNSSIEEKQLQYINSVKRAIQKSKNKQW